MLRCTRCGQSNTEEICGQCQQEGGVPGMTRIRDALTLLPTDFFSVTHAQDRLGYYYNYTLRLLRYLKRSGLVEHELDQFQITREGRRLKNKEEESMKVGRKKENKTLEHKERIIRHLREHPGCTVKELEQLCPELSYHGIYQHLNDWVQQGEITVERVGVKNIYSLPQSSVVKDKPLPEPEIPVEAYYKPQMLTPKISEEDTDDYEKGGITVIKSAAHSETHKCNCTGRWHTLKNRLIQAGELEALRVMVQIEEGG